MSLAAITPSKVEINFGPFPVDRYFLANTTGSGPLIYGCSTTITVQQCVQYVVSTGPNNYRSQGVTGIRFFFTLGGGWYSTPFDASGNVQAAWTANLNAFFADLYSYGIRTITPTPIVFDTWSGPLSSATVTTCGIAKSMNFFKWLPYGLDPSDSNYPDRTCGNSSYYYAASNPYFWGWTPFFNLIDQVLAKAQATGLTVNDLDYNQELNCSEFTVEARIIYDYATGTDVISAIRQRMLNHGFAYGAAAPSVTKDTSSVATDDCGSFYGDSAQLIPLSELIAALAGPGTVFGDPPYNYVRGLKWYLNSSTAGMVSVPISHSQPTTTDVHSQTTFASTSDTQVWAQTFYSDLAAFLVYRGLTANLVNFGETNPVDAPGCTVFSQAQATAMINGYLLSSLYSGYAANVTMRPWHSVADPCTPSPNIINPPFAP